MVVLALETATRRGSLALWRDGRSEGRPGDSTATHGERLPGELLDWLRSRGLTTHEVDYYAITSGPGSFTGLRVGLAVVQGLALPAGRRVVPVPTLESLAEAYLASGGASHGVLVPCLDGQRGDVFASAYAVSGASTIDDATLVLDAEAGPPGELARKVLALAGDAPVVFAGDGAARYAATLRDAAPDAGQVQPEMTLAEATARLAARRTDAAVRPHAVRPVYVRRPDAFLARDRARRRTDAAAAAPEPGGVVRAAGPADFEAVAALQRQTFSNAWSVDAIRWELEHTDVARLYVLESPEDGLLAYCACWIVFDELHINSLAVADSSRRRGRARQLLRQVFRDAVAGGARSATLEVRESNAAARALYEGLGFQVEGRRRNYYQAPREDALVLWHRHLAGGPVG
jgi:tRNA threonylcarbamoyl adenosine modification protein YeaZ/ribosomal-protein-alanine acetyltransferase